MADYNITKASDLPISSQMSGQSLVGVDANNEATLLPVSLISSDIQQATSAVETKLTTRIKKVEDDYCGDMGLLNGTPLAEAIDAEISDRENADTSLKTTITSETDAKIKTLTSKDTALQAGIDRLDRGLAFYYDSLDDGTKFIDLNIEQTGKAVLADGTIADRAGYFISREINLVAGDIYLIDATKAIGIDVAALAKKVTEDTIVPIQWTYVYDSYGEATEATNDYEPNNIYRPNGDDTWTNEDGENIGSLPMTRVVSADSYVTLFRNAGDTPKSGYYAVVAPETCKAVVSQRTDNPNGDRVYVAAYGAIRSLAINKAQKSDVVALESRVTEAEGRLSEQQLERLRDIADQASARLKTAGKPMFYGYIPAVEGGKRGHWQDVSQGSDEAKACTMICGGYINDTVTSIGAYFNLHKSLLFADLTTLDTSKVTAMQQLFQACTALQSVDMSGLDTSAVTNMLSMFSACTALQSVDVSGWDTSKVTSMNWMFFNCFSLERIDITGWDTSAVTKMENTFYSDNLRYIALGWAFFKTTVAIPLSGSNSLGLAGDNSTSNGWIGHLADVAPWILAEDASDLATQIAAFTAEYGAYKTDSSLSDFENFKAAIEDAGQHYLEDYTSRTIQLASALKNKAWAAEAISLLQAKGFTIG